MRMLLSTVGTRGDVQPVMALALAARAQGHEARLAVPPNFLDWAAELGFPATAVGVEMRPPKPGAPPPVIPDLIADQFETVGAAAEAGCDLIVGGGAHQYAARSIAERLGVPFVDAVYAPVALPSPDHPPGGPPRGDGSQANLDLWSEHKAGWNARALERVNANRARLGLAAIDDVLDHVLGEEAWLACDALLGPAPASPGRRVVQTGAWLLADETALPAELEAFLQAGEPPVYLGFGSMPAAPDAGAPLIEAVRALGRRLVLSQGWAGLALDDRADDVIVVGDVSHQALFPRVAAVVHHGGAGTTTAAALAGAPQVVAPMFSDQFYWAGRVQALGVGSAVAAGADAAALALALGAALGPAVAEQARGVAGQVRRDGADVAVRRLAEAYG